MVQDTVNINPRRTGGFGLFVITTLLICNFFVGIVIAQEVVTDTVPTTMVASWYGKPFLGHKTASGEIYDGKKITVAHKSYRFGTILKICYKARCILATVNDRGPYIEGRDIDLSVASAEALHFTGVHPVRVTVVSVPKRRESRPQNLAHDGRVTIVPDAIQPIVPRYQYSRHAEEE